ncbi:MAG: trigger factor [Spartobacteria bacterium]|nr:trigger factor [Spartobacteria bacterium]
MQVDIRDAGPCRKTLEISYSSDEVKDKYELMLNTYVKQANIPGFRPGRAPRALVAKKFAGEMLTRVGEALMSDGYKTAITEHKIAAITLMDFSGKLESFEKGVTYTYTLDVPPEFELPEYKNIPVTALPTTVEEAEIDEAIENVRKRMASYEDMDEGELADNDFVQIDYQATQNGTPLDISGHEDVKELCVGEGAWIPLVKDNQFLPGFVEGLVGHRVGDELDIEIEIGEHEKLKVLGIETAVYHVRILKVRSPKLPELDQKFFKDVNVADLEDLREKISESIAKTKVERDRTDRGNQIIKELFSKTSFDLPESVVEEATRQEIQNIVGMNLKRGVTEEEITEHKDQLFASAAHSAKERVKLRYILYRIASEEKIDVSMDEIKQDILMQAIHNRMDVKELLKYYENDQQMNTLRGQLRDRKTLDFLIDQAQVSE